MKRIGIYYRVSTEKQDIEMQKKAIKIWLDGLPEDKKPQQITEYIDEGISGTKKDREAYQRLIADCRHYMIDSIVVYKLDRFSRDASDAIRTIIELDNYGVAFISVTQPILNLGHENPFRRTMLAAFAEIAEIERETIVQRVKMGLKAAKAKGKKLGAPKKITEEQEREIIEKRKAGMAYRAIAKDLGLSFGSVYKIAKPLEDSSAP